jgi:DNA-binding NtrC family response regulator
MPLISAHVLSAALMGKRINAVPSTTMQKLERLSWPGNVRELENLVDPLTLKLPRAKRVENREHVAEQLIQKLLAENET